MSFTPAEIRVRLGILNQVIETTDPAEPKLAEVRRQIASLEAQLVAAEAKTNSGGAPAPPVSNPAAPPPVVVGLKPLRLTGRARR